MAQFNLNIKSLQQLSDNALIKQIRNEALNNPDDFYEYVLNSITVETAIDIFVNVFLAESEWYVWFNGPNPKSKYDVEFAYYGLYDFETILNNRCRLTVYELFNVINNSDYDRITTAIVYIFFSEYATIYARTKAVDYERDEDFIPDDIDSDEYYENIYQPALNVWRAYIASMDLVNNKKLLKKSTYLLLNKFPDCIRTLNDGIDLYWTYIFQ